MTSSRPSGRRARCAVSLAAAVAVAVGASACSSDRDVPSPGIATPTPTSAATAPPADATSAPPGGGASASPPVDRTDGAPEQAALAFVEAVAQGDTDDAYALLSARSQQAVGGPDGFAAMSSALAEGFGAFADAQPRPLRTELGDDAGVVTLTADVQREGLAERGAAATLPYRLDASGDVGLEPFGRAGGTVEFASPRPGATATAGSPVQVFVPAATQPVLTLDGNPLKVEIRGADGDQQELTGTLPADLAPGRHVLTAAWVDRDGRLAADAIVVPTS